MGRQLQIVRAGERRDAHRLGDAAADRKIGLHDIDRGERRQIAEIVPGEFAFTGGDRNIGGGADLRLPALVVGGDRLLEPGEVALLDQAAETLCRGDRAPERRGPRAARNGLAYRSKASPTAE